jgi:prepilin signal peptidase PulO-like enzyme (type II secretory pathway)
LWLRLCRQRLDADPGRLANAQEQAVILPLAISLFAVVWLGVCAFFDARTRQVSNWLTLPAIPFALLAAWIGVVIYFVGLLIVCRSRPVRFAGVPEFALGAGLFTAGQVALVFVQRLAI